MQTDFDVNPVYEQWKVATGRQKEWLLQELAEKLSKYATAICWSRLPDRGDDFGPLTNDIVIHALNKMHQFEGKAKFSTWFYRVATNICNRHLRQLKESAEIAYDEYFDPITSFIDERIDLIAVLDGLPAIDHLLVKLIVEGQDFKTIAKELGISNGAAKVRWSRLRRRLQDAL